MLLLWLELMMDLEQSKYQVRGVIEASSTILTPRHPTERGVADQYLWPLSR